MMGNQPIQLLILGAGGRGDVYARHASAMGAVVAGVVDVNPERLKQFGDLYHVPEERRYLTWEEALSVGKFADAVVNSTPDRIHYASTMAALDRGYHVLLEKPMAPLESECREMVKKAEEKGLLLMVCHVLRYAPFFEKLKELHDGGALGELVNFELTEHVAYWHFAHAYVRGIFRNEASSSPWILAKSCHDLDIIAYITGRRALSAVAEGSLLHFVAENAPEGAPDHCLDGCPAETTCPYFAPRLYLKQIDRVYWPSTNVSVDTSYTARYHALEKGPFGRCVYRCDNNQPDHLSSVFRLEGGVTASFNMIGLSSENTRTLRLYGTKGDVKGDLDAGILEFTEFLTGKTTRLDTNDPSNQSSHGGGDARLTRDFLDALEAMAQGKAPQVRTSAKLSLQSHLMGFAVEKSRKEGGRIAIPLDD